jgi:peptidoglycan/xylan/chitin deacetylase (PgdA/CDA1 family)
MFMSESLAHRGWRACKNGKMNSDMAEASVLEQPVVGETALETPFHGQSSASFVSLQDAVVPEAAVPEVAAQERIWLRVLAFGVVTLLLWGTYFWWRPPLPMLFLRHSEHLGQASSAVSITFDDAPHPLTTPLLLAALKRANAKATFFVVGDGLRLYPELAHRIVQEGHTLANHSQNHHNLTRVGTEAYSTEIQSCFDAIQQVYRNANSPAQTRLFRPPGGGLNRQVMQYLYDNNIELAWWSNNVGDWAQPPGWKIVQQVKAKLRPGDIILLHDGPGGYGTAQAIPEIVRTARRLNLECVTMPESSRH